jgi:hypothetical protein
VTVIKVMIIVASLDIACPAAILPPVGLLVEELLIH